MPLLNSGTLIEINTNQTTPISPIFYYITSPFCIVKEVKGLARETKCEEEPNSIYTSGLESPKAPEAHSQCR